MKNVIFFLSALFSIALSFAFATEKKDELKDGDLGKYFAEIERK
jgi:hypothetical protein